MSSDDYKDSDERKKLAIGKIEAAYKGFNHLRYHITPFVNNIDTGCPNVETLELLVSEEAGIFALLKNLGVDDGYRAYNLIDAMAKNYEPGEIEPLKASLEELAGVRAAAEDIRYHLFHNIAGRSSGCDDAPTARMVAALGKKAQEAALAS